MRRPDPIALMALLALPAITLPTIALRAEPGREQGEVRREMRAGNVRTLRDIEQRIKAQMPGMQFLGSEYDPAAVAYRLKFIHSGRVVFVDVDARSGAIINQSR